MHLVKTSTFRSDRMEENFTMRGRFTCETTNMVYLLFCNTCRYAQYVGETKNSLWARFAQHRSDIKRNTGTLVTRHFNSPNHTIENLKCVVVERVHSNKVTARKKRESFWMSKLQTLTPDGLNTREEAPWDG